MSGHDKEYIDKFQFENTRENRQTLAELIVSYWDMKDLVAFAEERLADTWNPAMHPEDADLYWAEDVVSNKDALEDLTD